MDEVWNEHGFHETLDLAAREIQLVWHVLPGASTTDINKHFQSHLNGIDAQLFEERIVFLSMLNDIDWTKYGYTEICMAQRQRSGSICGTIQARTSVLREACVKKRRGGKETPNVCPHCHQYYI